MGTDIHLYVERRVGGAWVSCDTWENDSYEPDRLTVPYGKHFYDTRSYDTFAILADVRNGRGFAGVVTGEGFTPISEPKGLPDDMSPELAAEAEGVDHTPSWLTVKEIMDFDWTQTTIKSGILSGPEYNAWESFKKHRGEGPDGWRGGIMGGRVVHVEEPEMLAMVRALRERYKDYQLCQKKIAEELKNTYCRVSWPTSYHRAASCFLSECLPRLWRFGAPEDVRIVFWFDS